MATVSRQLSFSLGGLALGRTAVLPSAWLFVRIVLGVEWVRAGWEKIGDAGWTKAPVGGAVEGFLRGAIAKSQGERPEVQSWFASLTEDVFLPNADAFAYLVSYGELLVGLSLIVGLFTRPSVLLGAVMNLAFLFAGTTSTNPQMLILGLALAGLGTGAGAYGLDRWVLPLLKAKAGLSLVQTALAGALISAAFAAAWLTWITTDAETWLVAALIGVLTFIAFGARRSRPGARELLSKQSSLG